MNAKACLLKRPITVALAGFGFLLAAHSAHAATYTVTNTNDAGVGSLRDAIAQANTNPGADTIVFSGVTGTIALASGALQITDSVTITGPGAGSLSVSGNNVSGVFELSGSGTNVTTISDLSIVNGSASIGAGIVIGDGTTTLNRVRFANNAATSRGGAMAADGFSMTLSISDCTFSGNTAVKGGAIYIEDTGPAVTISRSVFSGNTANEGGAIYLYDPDNNLTIDQSVFSNNSATVSGGAIHLYSFDAGTFTISNSVFSGNTAAKGGALYADKLDLPMLVVNSTFTGNSATAGGGGAMATARASGANLTIRETTIVGNTATTNGGGTSFAGTATVTVVNTVIAGNTAPTSADAGGVVGLSVSNSLIQTSTAAITNNGGLLQNIAANIGALAANGGPSVGAPGYTAVLQTMLPNAGSPLIDAGTATGVLATDQRGVGFPRIVGSAPDIGAAEYQTFQVTGLVTPVGGGTLVCAPNPVLRGQSVICTATANPGYTFAGFSGDCSGLSCTLSNVTGNRTVSARFNAVSPTVVPVFSGLHSLFMMGLIVLTAGLRGRRK